MGFFSVKAIALLSSYYGKSNLRVLYVFGKEKNKKQNQTKKPTKKKKTQIQKARSNQTKMKLMLPLHVPLIKLICSDLAFSNCQQVQVKTLVI